MKKNWPIFAILVLALILMIPQLNHSFWLDEAAQALESTRPFALQSQITDDFQPPFLHYLLHFASLISHQEWWLRLWAGVIPGLLTVFGTFVLAKKLFSRRIATLAALLVATSSFMIYFAQELRPYMWSAAWAMLAWIFLLESVKVGSEAWTIRANSWWDKTLRKVPFGRDFWLFMIFSVAGLYTSYLYPFVFITQLIYLLIRKKFKLCVWAIIISVICYLPWLPEFWLQLQAGTALRTAMPGWSEVVSFTPLRAIAMTGAKFIYGVSDLEFSLFYILSGAFITTLVVVCLVLHFGRLWKDKKTAVSSIIMALVGPFITAWIVSFWVPVIQPKRMIFLLPLVLILIVVIAIGWEDVKLKIDAKWWRRAKNWPGVLLLGGLLFLNVYSLIQYWTMPNLQREDWRSLWTQVRAERGAENSIALFAYVDPFSPWMWYEEEALKSGEETVAFPYLTTGNYYLPEHPESLNQMNYLGDYENVLIFDYLRDLTDPERELDDVVEAQGFVWTETYDYPNIGFVRVYTREAGDDVVLDASDMAPEMETGASE